MSADQAHTGTKTDELEAAIDALLAEIDQTCTRYENPPEDTGDEELEEYAKAARAVVTKQAEEEPAAEPDAPATNNAEDAIDRAGSSADELLERAADELIETLESEVDQAREPDPDASETPTPADGAAAPAERAPENPGTEIDAQSDLLAGAVDELLSEPSGASDTAEARTEVPPPGSPPEQPAPDAGADTDSFEDLDAVLDDLLDGSFETPDGQAADTEGVDTAPDPSLMLDKDGPKDAPPSEPGAKPDGVDQPEPACENATAEPPPAPAPDTTEPGTGVPETATTPEPSRPATAPTPTPAPRSKPGVPDRVRGVGAWLRPRASVAAEKAWRAAEPLAARAVIALSKPLEGKPPRVRDSIGWVAIWTLFLAACVWVALLLRSPETPAVSPDASRVVTAETDPAG